MSSASDHPSSAPPGANTRRVAGVRREASLRVVVYVGDTEVEGWSLNLSPGGLRAILTEHAVTAGDQCEVALSDRGGHRRPCRVAWTQEKQDGQIVGFEFIGNPRDSTLPPAPA